MMTSDSEDDNDDASESQHYDNQVENFVPVATASASSSLSNGVVVVLAPLQSNSIQIDSDTAQVQSLRGESQRDEVEVNTEQGASSGDRGSPRPRDVAVADVAQQEAVANDDSEVSNQGSPAIEEEDDDGDGIPPYFIRLRGFSNHNHNRNVGAVDSDSDDPETASDDSEMEFQLIVPDDDGESNRASSDDNETQGDDGENLLQEFDPELPIRHSYLGEGMEELQGRVMLEEDATPEIPLIGLGIHLIPGQTLPLTIFHAVFQNAIRRCVMTDRLFGIVHNDMDMPSGNVVYKGALGTLAEIYEYQEESDAEGPGSMSSSFALKAKGRQRFNVIEVRRQADGNLMGKVRVRPEIKLEPFVLNILLPGVSRCFLPKQIEDLEEENANASVTIVPAVDTAAPPQPQYRSSSVSRFSFTRLDSVASTASTTTIGPDKDLLALQAKIKDQRKRLKYYSALTPHPYFVYEQYDETILVEKVHRLLKTELRGLAESGGKIPVDASDLSFWLAQNLTMDDAYRTKVLKMDSPVQRLRYELELLARTTKVISCRNCQTNIADHSQIFSMSIEGPQATYVNPHGFVHETLTVHRTKELMSRGLPSTESSWFPGYSWTIVECKRCKSHVGWKFQAVGRLKPSRFWGLARRSVIFKYDFGSDSDLQEPLESHNTPPNSANSEAFSTVALF